jgi:hypothetical protein
MFSETDPFPRDRGWSSSSHILLEEVRFAFPQKGLVSVGLHATPQRQPASLRMGDRCIRRMRHFACPSKSSLQIGAHARHRRTPYWICPWKLIGGTLRCGFPVQSRKPTCWRSDVCEAISWDHRPPYGASLAIAICRCPFSPIHLLDAFVLRHSAPVLGLPSSRQQSPCAKHFRIGLRHSLMFGREAKPVSRTAI